MRFALLVLLAAGLHRPAARAAAPALHDFPTIKADAAGKILQASMIWAEPGVDKTGVAVAFRKSFVLPQKPARAELSIFADVRYVLWINGTYVDRGPSRFQPNGPQYDVVNVAPHLRAGRNSIVVLVVGNLSGGKVMLHRPGFTALLEADGREVLRTDSSWKWSDATRYREVAASWPDLGETVVDTRVEDGDWTVPDYDDLKWKPAAKIGAESWGAFTRTLIPPLRESEVPVKLSGGVTFPAKLEAGQRIEFDTTRIVQAYPLIELDAEGDAELGIEPFGVKYHARAGKQRHFTIDTRGISHGAIVVKSGRVTITGFKLIERLYPFNRLGSFECSDGFLNRLWKMCARSIEVLSEDCYVDCADRERVEWMDCDPPGWDMTRVAMSAPGLDGKPVFSDARLLGAMVRRTGLTLQPDGWVKAHTCSDRFDIHAKMEDRTCEWVAGIRRYHDATADTALVREIWPAVVAQMEYFLARRTPRGLVRARDWVVWGNPLGYLEGETTTLNVFVQRALADASLLATTIGEKQSSAKFAKAATELAHAINTLLWDEASGSYFSGYFDDADQAPQGDRKIPFPVTNHRTPTTLHANVFALDRGVVPAERRARVLANVVEQQQPLNGGAVMIYHYLAKLLYGLDQPALDVRVLELWRRNWRPMTDSAWECSWEDLGGGSKAHCYGLFPGYFLSSYVLGVRRDAPVAEKRIVIQPHPGDLTHAAGVVVTEFGPVPVSWKIANRAFEFSFTVPPGVKADVLLPAGAEGVVLLNGQPAKTVSRGRWRAFEAGPGKYQGSAPAPPPVIVPSESEKNGRVISAAGARIVITAFTDSIADGLEDDIPRERLDVTAHDVVTDASGGSDAGAVVNATTRNGSGGGETFNDGKTYRGYGEGHSLTLRLDTAKSPGGYDLDGLFTFAGHADSRAGQRYRVSVSTVDAPERFQPLAVAQFAHNGGASEIRIASADKKPLARRVAAVRFEFDNGPHGFHVYREFSLTGKPSAP